MLTTVTDVDNHDHYRLLIHSLTHEHTHANGDRHLLLIQKWIRDNDDGIMLRDLEYVTELLKILKGFLISNNAVFQPAVISILDLCCKPLLESKANERLRTKGIADMKFFYKAIAAFCLDADNELKIEVVHCFRCIVNGGRDPLVLRADVVNSKNKRNKLPITDTSFVQTLIRDCSIIDFIVFEFLDSVDIFEKAARDFSESSLIYTQGLQRPNSMTTKRQTLRETLREYGIPEDYKIDDEYSEEEKATATDGSKNQEDEFELMIDNVDDDIATKTLPILKAEKASVNVRERLTTDLAELCTDLAADPKSAEMMSAMRLCDGVIKFLQYVIQENVRDKRVATTIGLLWTLLDSAMGKENIDLEKSSVLASSVADAGIESSSVDLCEVIELSSALCVLHSMITMFAQDGFKGPDKECRNEVLSVLTLIAESSSSHPFFIHTGLLNDLVYFACYAECSSMCGAFPEWLDLHPQASSNPRNFATASELDLQFKRGIWILVSDLLKSGDPDALACVGQSPLLLSLLLYLEYDTLPMNNQRNITPSGTLSRPQSPQGDVEAFGEVPSFAESSQPSLLQLDGENDGSRVPSNDDPRIPGVRHTFEDPYPDRFSKTKDSEDTYNNLLVRTTKSPQTVPQFATGNIPEGHSFLAAIPMVQMLQLQVLAVTLLADVASQFVEEILLAEGPLRIFNVARHYCNSDLTDHVVVVGTLLMLLNRLLYASQDVRAVMERQNAVQFFLFLFERSEEEQTKAQAVRAISILCGGSTACQTQLREQEGIQFLVLAVRRTVEQKKPLVGLRAGMTVVPKYAMDQDDPALAPLAGDISVYIVAMLDCIAKAVVGNRMSETCFASNDGMDALLGLLEVSPYVLRLPTLRLISDLLDNSEMVPFVRAWLSPKTMRPAVQLATHCWLDEEVRLGGVRGGGVISNIMDPLGGHNWPGPSSGAGDAPQGVNFSMSTTSVGTETCRSVAVSRLSAAILHSRFTDNIPAGNVPLAMRHAVLEKDIRGVVASVLQLLGAFDHMSILGAERSNNSATIECPDDGQNSVNPSVGSYTSVIARKGLDDDDSIAPAERDTHRNTGQQLNASVGSLRSPFQAKQSTFDARSITTEELRVLQDENDVSLTVAERQVVAIARRYAVLREGSWWTDVSESLRRDFLQPIESDMTMIKARLDTYFTAAQMVHMEQMILRDVEDTTTQATERQFLNQIVTRRDQDAKAKSNKTSCVGTAKSHTPGSARF